MIAAAVRPFNAVPCLPLPMPADVRDPDRFLQIGAGDLIMAISRFRLIATKEAYWVQSEPEG